MPGRALGFASERLIWAEPQALIGTPLNVVTPLFCRPLIEPAAARSTVPRGDGERVISPTRFTSPENAVARSVAGINWETLVKGVTLLSSRRSHGWKVEAESVFSWKSSSFCSHTPRSGGGRAPRARGGGAGVW